VQSNQQGGHQPLSKCKASAVSSAERVVHDEEESQGSAGSALGHFGNHNSNGNKSTLFLNRHPFLPLSFQTFKVAKPTLPIYMGLT
jgi:hypothetical protein